MAVWLDEVLSEERLLSTERAPPPLMRRAMQMPITSRWYSNPSPCCRPNQFMKKPFCT